MNEILTAQEQVEVNDKIDRFLEKCKKKYDDPSLTAITKAIHLAQKGYLQSQRKGKDPNIFHPLDIATILLEELETGYLPIVCALLHNIVEYSPITYTEIAEIFGEQTTKIIKGLHKISTIQMDRASENPENFRKLLLILSGDIRVILIKIAHRLSKMRQLRKTNETTPPTSYAIETISLFSPLAHRLGLYKIKQELEDLSLQTIDPVSYETIHHRLAETEEQRETFIKQFADLIDEKIAKMEVPYTIKGRPKSVYSIWNKMRGKKVDMDELYDLFAIRIILNSHKEDEKSDCWKVFSIVTDMYNPDPKRLKDWLSVPKSNGYESLHTTVMTPQGKWVEVQIRTERMDAIAERGLAAHWVYKEGGNEAVNKSKGVDNWLSEIRNILENKDMDDSEIIDNFKMSLYEDEIFVFTPAGELKNLPFGATVLDFAYLIHSAIGNQCVGGKINGKIVPFKTTLNSGDQVEIIISKTQKPSLGWLDLVITPNAKSRIRKFLNDESFKEAEAGREILERKFKNWKIEFNHAHVEKIAKFFKIKKIKDLYCEIAADRIDPMVIKEILTSKEEEKAKTESAENKQDIHYSLDPINNTEKSNSLIVFDTSTKNVDYSFAECCTPLYGDDIFGFVTVNKGITIHRKNCPNSKNMLNQMGYRVISAQWFPKDGQIASQAVIYLTAVDRSGIVSEMSHLMSKETKAIMTSISFTSEDGIINGYIKVDLKQKTYINTLLEKLRNVEGVQRVVV